MFLKMERTDHTQFMKEITFKEKRATTRMGYLPIGGGGLNPTTLLNKGLPSRKKFKRGGHVKKKNIDGIAKKGKTRGTII